MKIRDLIEELQNLDPNLEVLLQADAEGNGYDSLRCVEQVAFYKDGREYTVYNLDWSSDDCCLEPEEWEHLKKNSKALVLAP